MKKVWKLRKVLSTKYFSSFKIRIPNFEFHDLTSSFEKILYRLLKSDLLTQTRMVCISFQLASIVWSPLGLNRTSRPVPVVREFSNVRIPDLPVFSFPDSGHLTLLKFKKSPRFLFSTWLFSCWRKRNCRSHVVVMNMQLHD